MKRGTISRVELETGCKIVGIGWDLDGTPTCDLKIPDEAKTIEFPVWVIPRSIDVPNKIITCAVVESA